MRRRKTQAQLAVVAATAGLLLVGCGSTSGEAAKAAGDSTILGTTKAVTATIT